jgi:hypothetical protein
MFEHLKHNIKGKAFHTSEAMKGPSGRLDQIEDA